MGWRFSKTALLLSLAMFLVSCAAHLPRYRPDPSNPVYTVAVLPFYNVSNDVGGAMALRGELHRRVSHMHYGAMPLKEVDEILLNRMGITLGAQLEMTDAVELGRTLGVDAVVYGWVLDFDHITAGVYNVKKVRAAFRFVDTRSGKAIWQGAKGVKTVLSGGGTAGAGASVLKEVLDRDFTPDTIEGLAEVPGVKDWHYIFAAATKKVEDAAVISLGEKLVTKAFGVHMWMESNAMMDLALKGFPAGPGALRRD